MTDCDWCCGSHNDHETGCPLDAARRERARHLGWLLGSFHAGHDAAVRLDNAGYPMAAKAFRTIANARLVMYRSGGVS